MNRTKILYGEDEHWVYWEMDVIEDERTGREWEEPDIRKVEDKAGKELPLDKKTSDFYIEYIQFMMDNGEET
mgnify:FL=1|tara:strand:- start:188 stop:403 length:216 start_codon:yes stop_codon:yes gene_type:complete